MTECNDVYRLSKGKYMYINISCASIHITGLITKVQPAIINNFNPQSPACSLFYQEPVKCILSC
jgi:hypothetical protein